jgi:hypothetical protein
MPKNIFRYIATIVLVIIFGFGFGYLKTFVSLRIPEKELQQDGLDNLDVSQSEEIKIDRNTRFIYEIYYIKCGHRTVEENTAQKLYWGLTKDRLEKELGDTWEIQNFIPEEVLLIKSLDKACENHFYVGISDGYVTLFQGIPGNKSKVIEKTDIIAGILRHEDRTILESGLIIEDEQEFLRIREGLTN